MGPGPQDQAPLASTSPNPQHVAAHFDHFNLAGLAETETVHAQRGHAHRGALQPVVRPRHAGRALTGSAEVERVARTPARWKRKRIAGTIDLVGSDVLLERMRPRAAEALFAAAHHWFASSVWPA